LKYRYRASETFWRQFYRLPAAKKESVRRAWQIFKADPFAPALGVHKIHSLSSLYKKDDSFGGDRERPLGGFLLGRGYGFHRGCGNPQIYG
jgi:hypothetical protein